ncbi:hypothetical protein ABZ723_15325 [Streptomyces sp. NPDC006700]|uniref:hypothetical protein n=1 Tax=unclassified Streptomyces TaxID=2593676 RepID=UPI0033C37776
MHMNSVPQHLLSEDRQEYERILDEALRAAPHHLEPTAAGQRLNSEQLRTMALSATAVITATAATEYHHYVKLREELRRPAPAVPSSLTEAGSADPGGPVRLAATMDEAAETHGAGAGAVVAVLAPVLAGTAAALFLLLGYILRMLDPAQAFAQSMITAGWVFGALTAAAILAAAAGLLLTALRNRPSLHSDTYAELGEEVAQARDAWQEALLERGILPFLHEALADPRSPSAGYTGPAAPTGRMPQLGYDRPGFSSPDDGAPTRRPRFSSPDFSSPDFGGPEHQPE